MCRSADEKVARGWWDPDPGLPLGQWLSSPIFSVCGDSIDQNRCALGLAEMLCGSRIAARGPWAPAWTSPHLRARLAKEATMQRDGGVGRAGRPLGSWSLYPWPPPLWCLSEQLGQ